MKFYIHDLVIDRDNVGYVILSLNGKDYMTILTDNGPKEVRQENYRHPNLKEDLILKIEGSDYRFDMGPIKSLPKP